MLQIPLDKPSGPRITSSIFERSFVLLASFVAAVLTGAVLLALTGFDPVIAYGRMLTSSVGSQFACVQTLQYAAPILLCALSVAIPAKLKLWNIGADGQFYAGALATTGVFLLWPGLPSILMLPTMAVAAMLGGMLWMAIPALLRIFWSVSEILTTLMFNYIALPLVNYLLYGPWRNPGSFNFPGTRRFTDNAWLPTLHGFPIHIGVLAAVVLALSIHWIIRNTVQGLQLRAAGDNRNAALYSGYNVHVIELVSLAASGLLAGLAGMIQVAGVTHQMLPNLSPGFGFSGIIVASLALTNILACIGLSVLFAMLTVGSQGVESIGVPVGIANFLSGIVLLFLLVGPALFHIQRSLSWIRPNADNAEN
jgi:general nucleoside transport system permease protein